MLAGCKESAGEFAQVRNGPRFQMNNIKRGSEWGGPLVGCRLKFNYFVGSRLKFSIFVDSRLNFSIFVGCRKISVNK